MFLLQRADPEICLTDCPRFFPHFRFNIRKIHGVFQTFDQSFPSNRTLAELNSRTHAHERACTWLHNARLACKISKQQGECSQLSRKLNFVQLPECYVIHIYMCIHIYAHDVYCLMTRVTRTKRDQRCTTRHRCGTTGSSSSSGSGSSSGSISSLPHCVLVVRVDDARAKHDVNSIPVRR